MTIPVVDVFAGPGGLNEGFSALRGGEAFRTVASIEMDGMACRTLKLRAAVRRARRLDGVLPDSYYEFIKAKQLTLRALREDNAMSVHVKAADAEVHELELGPATKQRSRQIIGKALESTRANGSPWVLIGGPPCQAYSLAGRSRRKHDSTFPDDHKHTLYREYLRIIEEFSPHAFVMENVKGMLSSKHDGGGIFQAIRKDLENPGYELRSFVVDGVGDEILPHDFVIKSEQFGIPQARHRVILLGVRSDVAESSRFAQLTPRATVRVDEAIGDLPSISAIVSRSDGDEAAAWQRAMRLGLQEAGVAIEDDTVMPRPKLGVPRGEDLLPGPTGELGNWLRSEDASGVLQHESRRHMETDLARYAYLAALAADGVTRRVNELPRALVPNHRNASRADAPFADRFRVQRADGPSSTITSHIAKDGHYYIHYDPTQMRSLSVREAARLQTFPDDYFFMGNRTQQYHQVGNAVPPFLAHQIAGVLADALGG